jgi:hypothetical protein
MNYNDNFKRDTYDPSRNAAESFDDRDDNEVNIDEKDAFNSPSDRVNHL